MITLDTYDIRLLKSNLNLSFEGLLNQGLITLAVVYGVVLPCLSVKPTASTSAGRPDSLPEECVFLGSDSRCLIHTFRPGICRMFPLARIYHEDGSFSYFLQEGECSHSTGVKIRISKWLGYPNIREYEHSVRIYHDALTDLRRQLKNNLPHEEQVAMQRSFLDDWFVKEKPGL